METITLGVLKRNFEEYSGVIQSKEMEDKINKDLEIVLNKVWDFVKKICLKKK